ncbi:MAG: glutathione S-transferase family protein [Panacagrimonas sp.]
MNQIKVSAFRWVPPFAQGLVRDLRVRWALEEAGLAYEEHLIGPEDQSSEVYRSLQPFGQVPTYEEGGLRLFESGAIVLHVAEGCEALLPSDPAAAARVKTWMFAALNSIEPAIQNLAEIDLFNARESWAQQRRPAVADRVRGRLADLARGLGTRDYLEGRFSAADILMTTVLRILRHTELVAESPVLAAYQRRCESRPAFAKALSDQMRPFAANAPP